MSTCSKNCAKCGRCFRSELAILDQFTSQPQPSQRREGWGIAIDIGTTTVVLALVSLQDGQVIARCGFSNPQRRFGADVISRIQAASLGQLETMHTEIIKTLCSGISQLLEQGNVAVTDVKDVVIAGNTTMIYLLLGFACDSLGAFPFVPAYSLAPSYHAHQLFGADAPDCQVRIVPWISAFVGGDITAGITQLKTTGISLLVDIGTNGEMALSYPGGFVVTSTAAGPAFEGGHISCGMPCVAGAICQVNYSEGAFHCSTIENAPPIGICGTAILDIVAILVEENYIDETGRLCEAYFENGIPIAFAEDGTSLLVSQKDIREIQLAKSAVRSGIEILLLEAGITAEQVDYVYLAGGFGQAMNTDAALKIGLFPEKLDDKVMGLGNTSLAGAVTLLLNPQVELDKVIADAREINLATHTKFNEMFIDYMEF